MTKLDKDQVIENFTEAYTKANGKAPTIEAKGGWYSVDGAKNVRLAELQEQIATMGSSSAANQTEKPQAEKSTTAKKPASKKKSVKKANASGFSVKAFWAQKIKQDNSGARAPR